jgi:hypothetical protein
MPTAAKVLLSMGLLLLLLLSLVDSTSGNAGQRQRRKRRQLKVPGAADIPPIDDFSALALQNCGRLFVDGGSNTGESVRAFVKGNFFTCGLHSPNRQYASTWGKLSRHERVAAMQPLREPATFCIRSFEAAPELLPQLRRQEEELRAQRFDVRFVEAGLGNKTAAALPRTIVRYARNPWGVSATSLDFADVHVGGKPVPLEPARTVVGQSYDLRSVVIRALELNASTTIAIKLDIEGGEYWALESLVSDPELLCRISYLFTEFHSTASAEQRTVLTKYGLREDIFENLKSRAHAAMERPGCKLKVYWRSFWASCGDKQRFEWRTSAQASRETQDTAVPA